MKRLIGLIALLLTTGAFAQNASPKVAKKASCSRQAAIANGLRTSRHGQRHQDLGG
jgi:hypothetical protein